MNIKSVSMIRFFREISVIHTSSNLLFYEPLITTFCNQLFIFCSLIKLKIALLIVCFYTFNWFLELFLLFTFRFYRRL